MKIYKSLDFLPIWNFNKVQETNDLRYLYILKDYSDLPTSNNEDLASIFESLISELPKADLSLQYSYFKAVKARFDYIANIHNENTQSFIQRCENTFFDYMNELDSTKKIITYDGKKYDKAKDLHTYLKTIIKDFKVLVISRVDIFDYRTLESKAEKKNSNFWSEVFNIQKITGFKVDVHKTSVNEFYNLRDFAEKEIKAQRKANKKR